MQNNLTKPEIKIKSDNLEKYFLNIKMVSSKELEDVKQNLDKQEYKIAVVANMSSGKSTFINALFEKKYYQHLIMLQQIVPHVYILKTKYRKKKQNIFSDKEKVLQSLKIWKKEIKQYAQKDEDCKDNKYKNVEKNKFILSF